MMRRLVLLSLSIFLLSGCTRAASAPPPTEPALNFPTANPAGTPLCQPADLKTSSNFNDAGGEIVLGVTLTNQSKNPCALSNPPQPSLIDANSQPLDVQISALPSDQTPPAAAFMQLAPGESVIMTLVWRNFCQTLPGDSLIIRLNLADEKNLEIFINLLKVPNCEVKTDPSTALVATYSYPP